MEYFEEEKKEEYVDNTSYLKMTHKNAEILSEKISKNWIDFYSLTRLEAILEELKNHPYYFKYDKTYHIRIAIEKLAPLISIEKKHNIKFTQELITHSIFYDRNRYFAFEIDFMEYMATKSSGKNYYINNHHSCDKRYQIGKMIEKSPLKLILIYFSTSKQIRFYFNFKGYILKVSEKDMLKLTPRTLGNLIKADLLLEREIYAIKRVINTIKDDEHLKINLKIFHLASEKEKDMLSLCHYDELLRDLDDYKKLYSLEEEHDFFTIEDFLCILEHDTMKFKLHELDGKLVTPINIKRAINEDEIIRGFSDDNSRKYFPFWCFQLVFKGEIIFQSHFKGLIKTIHKTFLPTRLLAIINKSIELRKNQIYDYQKCESWMT